MRLNKLEWRVSKHIQDNYTLFINGRHTGMTVSLELIQAIIMEEHGDDYLSSFVISELEAYGLTVSEAKFAVSLFKDIKV